MKKTILLMIAMIVFASCSKDDEPKCFVMHLANTDWSYNEGGEQYALNFNTNILSYVKSIDNSTEWQSFYYTKLGNNLIFTPSVTGLDEISGSLISEDKIRLINKTTNKTVILSIEE